MFLRPVSVCLRPLRLSTWMQAKPVMTGRKNTCRWNVLILELGKRPLGCPEAKCFFLRPIGPKCFYDLILAKAASPAALLGPICHRHGPLAKERPCLMRGKTFIAVQNLVSHFCQFFQQRLVRAGLDAIYQAQGRGCAPGIIGVGIGGDRGTSMLLAKKQLFHKLDDRNPIPELAAAEEELLTKANTLKIGPMGFGGVTSVLGIQMGAMHRIPASYFVSIAYMCWADRRRSLFYQDGEISFD